MSLNKDKIKSIKKDLAWIMLGLFLVEGLSFIGFLYPIVNKTAFILIFLTAIVLSLKDIRYGLWLMLAELFIGGQGYLFHFQQAGLDVSIRIALWLALMSVYLAKVVSGSSRFSKSFKKTNLPYFGILLLFILWGGVNGFINNNGFSNIFLDANGWLYVLLILPIYHAFLKDKEFNASFIKLFSAAMAWLSVKTLFLEYVFSHKIHSIIEPVYRWVRTSGIGEITLMDSGFTRIFFQSHIFILLAFFLLLFFLNKKLENNDIHLLAPKKKKLVWMFVLSLSVVISMVLVSFSRSFWLASALAFMLYLMITLKMYGWKVCVKAISMIVGATLVSFLLLTAVIKFPYPSPSGVEFANALNERATKISGESAVSSRFKLLPKLFEKIKENPVLGQGFGATVTYRSSDPRILASTVDGEYTTYAFEWGWLDIWLEMGILGAIFYLFLNLRISIKNLKRGDWLSLSLAVGVILLATVNFFTPYSNHPLGFGILMIASLVSDSKRRSEPPLATD